MKKFVLIWTIVLVIAALVCTTTTVSLALWTQVSTDANLIVETPPIDENPSLKYQMYVPVKSSGHATDKTNSAYSRVQGTFAIDSVEYVNSISLSKVYYRNTNNWAAPYVFAWKNGDNAVYTPGVAMTLVSGNIYEASIPSTSNRVIFSDNGGNQSEHLAFDKSNPLYTPAPTDTWSYYYVNAVESGYSYTLTEQNVVDAIAYFRGKRNALIAILRDRIDKVRNNNQMDENDIVQQCNRMDEIVTELDAGSGVLNCLVYLAGLSLTTGEIFSAALNDADIDACRVYLNARSLALQDLIVGFSLSGWYGGVSLEYMEVPDEVSVKVKYVINDVTYVEYVLAPVVRIKTESDYADFAFGGTNTSITDMIIGSNVVEIAQGNFFGMAYLKTVTLKAYKVAGANPIYLYPYCFGGCVELESFDNQRDKPNAWDESFVLAGSITS